MGTPQDSQPESGEEKVKKPPETIHNDPVYAYNLDDTKTPGGLKVRFKIRVATGPEADLWDARQNQAILELLQWAHTRRTASRKPAQGR